MYFVIIFLFNLVFLIVFSFSAFRSDPVGFLSSDVTELLALPIVLSLYFALTAIRKTWSIDRIFYSKNEQRIREQILKYPYHQKDENEYKLDIKREVMLKGNLKIIEKEDSVEIEGPSFYINQLQKEFEKS